MPRSAQLDLHLDHPWRRAPMPGADAAIEMVPLASSGAPFAMLGRFPAGFARPVAGGYAVAEEFAVLAGGLVLDGADVATGDLVHVGAGRLRHDLRSPGGAVVLAWFTGAPEFIVADRFEADAEATLDVHALDETRSRPILTSVAEWSSGKARDWPERADGFDESAWASSAATWTRAGTDVVVWRTARGEADG